MPNSVYALQSTSPDQPPYPIAATGLRLGRVSDCDIVLSDDAVSRYHATVQVLNGQVFVTDHNSTNGTFVNEQRVPANIAYPLSANQLLRLGASTFTLTEQIVPPPISRYESAPSAARNNSLLFAGGGIALVVILFVVVIVQGRRPGSLPPARLSTMTPTASIMPAASDTALPPLVPIAPTPTLPPAMTSTPDSDAMLKTEMEAARSAMRQYGGQIDLAGGSSDKLNCIAIVANYNLVQVARQKQFANLPAERQVILTVYQQALDVFLNGSSDLTDACRKVVSGAVSTLPNVTLQSNTARAAVNGALAQLEPNLQ